MRRSVLGFWEEVREQLRRDLGQEAGRRDKKKALRRARLANELKLSDVTLRSFLNGNQSTLGPEALFALFAKMPTLKTLYEHASGSPRSAAKERRSKIEPGLLLQMSLQFEGSDRPAKLFTARLPAGRESILTVRIDRSRIA